MSNNELESVFNQAVDKILDQEHRHIKINFWITPSEERQLKAMCQGIKISKYIRCILFGYTQPRPKQTIPQVNRSTYIKLGKLVALIEKQTEAIKEAVYLNNSLSFIQSYINDLKELQQNINELRKEIAIVGNTLVELEQEEKLT